MLNKILNFVQKKLIILIILAIGAGLVNVKFFGGYQFTPLICLLAALVMIYPSLVPLSFKKIGQLKQNKKIILLSVFLNFVIIPVVAYGVGNLFLAEEPALRMGLILLALLPGGGMVTTWAVRSRANMITTVGIILVNLLLAIAITPFGISFAMNKLELNKPTFLQPSNFSQLNIDNFSSPIVQTINKQPAPECVVEKTTGGIASCDFMKGEVTPLKIAIPIIFIVVFPLILALITQKIILKRRGEEYFNSIKNKFGAFSNLGLIIVLFILMSLESNKIIFEHSILITDAILALVSFYGIILVIPWLLYKRVYHNSQGKALLWGSYLRYITLALGLGISLVYQNQAMSPIILIIVLSYLIQMPLSFIISRGLEKDGL